MHFYFYVKNLEVTLQTMLYNYATGSLCSLEPPPQVKLSSGLQKSDKLKHFIKFVFTFTAVHL